MRMRRVGIRMTVAMVVVTMCMVHLVAARIARMRTSESDGASDQRTDQRQEYKSLDHNWLSPSSD
jgi:type II secretory pathway component PulK